VNARVGALQARAESLMASEEDEKTRKKQKAA